MLTTEDRMMHAKSIRSMAIRALRFGDAATSRALLESAFRLELQAAVVRGSARERTLP